MSIVRLGRFIPQTLRDWDRVFESLNAVINRTGSATTITATTITADSIIGANVPAQDAAYVTLAANDSLGNERVLAVNGGELTIADQGAGREIIIGMEDVGTAGTYTKVTTDSKGRVTAGTTLSDSDIPASIARDSEVTAAVVAHVGESDPHTQYATNTELTTHEQSTADIHANADYAQTDVAETISGAWKFSDTVTLPKTSGKGIKVDTSSPTFAWVDLLGAISIRGVGATDPSYNVYYAGGGIRGYQFDANEEVFIEFHMPHDYVPGSDIHLHFHHSTNGKTTANVAGGPITGGTVTWGAEVTYSKGHNQAAFGAPITTTVASGTYASTLYKHYITEVQLSAASPTASQLDSDDLEVDGLILVRAYLSSNDITVSSGSVPAPFLHFVDVHYQSTGIGTKQKAPPFWT